MIWWLVFEKKPFQFWRYIWIQVVIILLQLYFNFRYIASWASLPSITDLLSTLGIARSLSDDPKVLQILEKIIDSVEENMPDLIKDNEKTERSAQDNFTNFLQSFDQSLINIRDAIRYSQLLFQNRIPIGICKEFRGHLLFLTGILVESSLLTTAPW